MKKNYTTLIVIIISLVPVGYLAYIWSSLPQIVPVHYNHRMEPDRMGSKSNLLVFTGVIALVSMLVYALLANIHRIDPKRRGTYQTSTFNKLGLGIVVFLSALNLFILNSAKATSNSQNFLFPLLGLLFAFLGNYMINIKPNYIAGFRLPWTLSDDNNWRKTHQMGGKLWFAGGILIAIVCLLLSSPVSFYFFLATVGIMVIVPAVYSYRLFKKSN